MLMYPLQEAEWEGVGIPSLKILYQWQKSCNHSSLLSKAYVISCWDINKEDVLDKTSEI